MVNSFMVTVKPLVTGLLKASVSADRNVPSEVLKAALQLQYGSVSKFAEAKKVSHNLIYAALLRPQPTGNHLIAEGLGVTVHQLWPTWFSPTGLRLRTGDDGNGRSTDRRNSSQKAVAA